MYRRIGQQTPPQKKNYLLFVGFIACVGLTIYPTIIYPMFYPEKYKKIQAETRKGINQEDIQPGNMRVWRDPFDRRKEIE